jgi:uncharacterized protein (DUF1015 family)
MAEIFPFRALHYNPAKIPDLSQVVTQPYDKITAEMQARYYDLSPYNLVRIIRGRRDPGDTPQDNVYARAARDFHAWIENHVLISEPGPALYPYYQKYEVPGQPGVRKQRRGFIGLCRVEDYSARVVYRHEETLSGPKADRLELLKATRAHFGQIFMLYSDPAGSLEALLAAHSEEKPWEQVKDEYGALHSVWRVTSPAAIEQIVTAMQAKKLVIADGHHRYETALAYRDHCRAQGKADPRAEYVMMTLIRMETEGLSILPTHRLVHSLGSFDWVGFAAHARRIFDWEDVQPQGSGREWQSRFLQDLVRAGRERPTLGAYAGPGKLALLRLRQDFDLDAALRDLPASLRRLDVILLHRLLLETILRIDRQAVREEKNLRYVREFDVAAEEIQQGKAQLCLLLNPTPVEAVRDNALAGQALPQKSTDFYPKLLSGLTAYWLDNPSGM